MRSLRTLLIAAAVLLLPSLASADGITWTLNDVTFIGGGSASGSFNYDAVSNLYSAVNVATTAGAPFAGSSYNTITDAIYFNSTAIGFGPNPFLNYNGGNLTGATVIELLFLNPLTNAGGTDSVYAVEFLCNDSTCDDPATRYSTSGFVSGSSVPAPEPSSLILLASALAAFFLFRRLM